MICRTKKWTLTILFYLSSMTVQSYQTLGNNEIEQIVSQNSAPRPSGFTRKDMPTLTNRSAISIVLPQNKWGEYVEQKVLPKFTRQTGVKVTAHLLSGSAMLLNQQRALSEAAGEFDVIVINSNRLKPWAYEGYLLPLSTLMNDSNLSCQHLCERFTSVQMKLSSLDDQLYAFPLSTQTRANHYRNDLFNNDNEKANFFSQASNFSPIPLSLYSGLIYTLSGSRCRPT